MNNLDRDLLFVIADVARLIRTRADQVARLHNMTRAQWIILVRVERQPGLSQSELASICEVEPISIMRLVDKLEARGLIERRRDPDDRRIKRLYLTAVARPVMQEIGTYRRQVVAEIMSGIPEELLASVIDGLLLMKANLVGRDDEPVPLRSAG